MRIVDCSLSLGSLGLACLMLGSAVIAQPPASYTFFGSGYGNYQPALSVTGLPQLGGQFTVTMKYEIGPPCSCGQTASTTPWTIFMITGASSTTWGSVPLPLPLPIGGRLLVSPDVVETRTLPFQGTCPPGVLSGTLPVSFTFRVPSQRSLIGMQLYQQLIVTHGSPSETYATQGGKAKIAP